MFYRSLFKTMKIITAKSNSAFVLYGCEFRFLTMMEEQIYMASYNKRLIFISNVVRTSNTLGKRHCKILSLCVKCTEHWLPPNSFGEISDLGFLLRFIDTCCFSLKLDINNRHFTQWPAYIYVIDRYMDRVFCGVLRL